MFEAVARRKVRFERVIDDLPRQPREDLITSTLFGSLQLLDHPGAVLDALLGDPPPGVPRWAAAEPKSFRFALWDRQKDRSEPDVLLEASFEGTRMLTLIEVKWGAPFQDEQIPRYVKSLGPKRQLARIVVLGFEAHHAAAIKRWQDVFDEQCKNEAHKKLSIETRTWREVALGLHPLADERSVDPPAVWAKQVRAFLRQTDKGRIFEGFGQLGIVAPRTVSWRFRLPWFGSTRSVRPTRWRFKQVEGT